MPADITAVIGALSGVLIGGLINYFASRSVKNHEWRLVLAKEQSTVRHKIYAEFLVETQRLVTQAREGKITSLSDLDLLNGKFAELSFVAPDRVLEAAKKLADYAITSHGAQPAEEVAEFFKLREVFVATARKDIATTLNGRA
jgi:hypothetical protein